MQNRFDSKVVKAAIVFAITYAAKEFYGFEIENKFIESCIIIIYFIWQVFAAMNNPKTKGKF